MGKAKTTRPGVFKHPPLKWPLTKLKLNQGLCIDRDKEQFFLDDSKNNEAHEKITLEAQAICLTPCPILEECLNFAYRNRLPGVYGGTTEGERKQIRRQRKRMGLE